MSTLLIHTKLSIPALRPTQISRLHLLQYLAAVQEPGVKLAVIAAPPGFGKTSLLLQWARQLPHPVAWLSLDEADNDNVRFWDYVIAAIQRVQPHIGSGVLALLHEPNPLPTMTILGMLLNEIAALSNPLFLVLDDYHTISAETIHQQLAFVLDYLPPQMRLIISSRTEPPLPMARLRVRDELVEVRAGELRFSSDETTAFLRQISGLQLAEEDIVALNRRTEGWAAGLQIAALALQGHTDASDFVQTFSGDHRFILDYLVDEVLARQPVEVQHFLLRTSILTRLTASLCELVTTQANAQQTLERLERDNLFVVALDERREWYRYHQLFTDFLRHRLRQQHAELIPELHRRASHWFARHGYFFEAVSHALAARDFEQAAQLIEETAELLLWRQPELHTLHGWLAALPEDLLALRPRLNLYYAWVLILTNHMGGAEQRVQQAARALDAQGPHVDPLVPGMLAAMRSSLIGLRRQFADTERHAREALALLPEETISWRCMAAISLGVSVAATGSVQEAASLLNYAMELSQEIGSGFALVSAFWHLASLQISQLQLEGAQQTCERLMRLLQEPEVLRFPAEGHVALLRGEVALERQELDIASSFLRASAEQINPEGFPMGLLRSYVALMRQCRAQNDPAGVEEFLAKANQLVVTHHLQTRSAPLDYYLARTWLEQGNLDAFSQWVEQHGLRVDDELVPYREQSYLLLARYLLLKARREQAEETLDRASTLLKRMLVQAEVGERAGSVIRSAALYSLALGQRGEMQSADEILAKALRLAEPERCVRVFADEGYPMANALAHLLESQRQGKIPESLLVSVPYVRNLLAVINAPQAATAYQPASGALVEPLSERELEVLRLLDSDLSSNDIAARLIISVETARKHIKNIYGKLAVHSRLEAVRRSRELGLL